MNKPANVKPNDHAKTKIIKLGIATTLTLGGAGSKIEAHRETKCGLPY
jgi:hypothetical protein